MKEKNQILIILISLIIGIIFGIVVSLKVDSKKDSISKNEKINRAAGLGSIGGFSFMTISCIIVIVINKINKNKYNMLKK